MMAAAANMAKNLKMYIRYRKRRDHEDREMDFSDELISLNLQCIRVMFQVALWKIRRGENVDRDRETRERE